VAALGGAQIIFYPTAIGNIMDQGEPAEGDWHDAWETVQRGHAISNSICVAAVNRVGREESLSFWGSSFVSDSFGNIVAKASGDREEVLLADLDLAKNKSVREGWGFFRNRRPDLYWPIIEMVKEPAPQIKAREAMMEEVDRKDALCLVDTPLQLGFHMPAEWEPDTQVPSLWIFRDDQVDAELLAFGSDAFHVYRRILHTRHERKVSRFLAACPNTGATVKRMSRMANTAEYRFFMVSSLDCVRNVCTLQWRTETSPRARAKIPKNG